MQIREGKPTRNAYGKAILELAANDSNIFVVDCDIGKSCRTVEFSEQYPNQHLNVGIAEIGRAHV